jgi:hypothetical protein
VSQVHSDTVAAGNVVSQSPAAGAEVQPGHAVDLVVSLGPVPAEGEPAEGEGEPVNTDTARQQLADNLDTADTNGDGALSFDEAVAAVPGLLRAVFNALDTNGDGQLSADELGVNRGAGCAGCRGGKGALSPLNRGLHLSDLFLFGLGLVGLVSMAGVRRP